MLRPALGLLLCSALAAVVLNLVPEEQIDCSAGGRACPPVLEAEDPREKLQAWDGRARAQNFPPPGALRAAYEGKKALEPAKAEISGANGIWAQYGSSPLIASGLARTLAADLGADAPDTNLQRWAGRVDDFAYDPVNKRLFKAVSTGGIWMSEARNGDVWTLGDHWQPIGDNLPYLATGGVIWLAGGGGTVIAATGDNVMSTGAYHGIGAYWSNDLGLTWHRSEGFPDDALVFATDIDRANPNIAYIGSSMGLFRTEDAGRTFQNVALPTTEFCAGNEDRSTRCNLANVVSGVVVKAPGGVKETLCSARGCPVLAAVGWRAGQLNYPGTEIPQSPANGLYRSETGEPGTFVRLDPAPVDKTTREGFTPADRIGRIEMGAAIGQNQDHDYVYAMVQDASFLNGDGADPTVDVLPVSRGGMLHGIYVSSDFGTTWKQMADSVEVGTIPGPLAALIAPGGQSWYNQWIAPDPTRAFPVTGEPTRVVFGLEEVFTNQVPHLPLNGTLQAGPQDFQNIGAYFSVTGVDLSTHADQHDGIYIPDGLGGVCLFAGHDGGTSRQCVTAGGEFTARGWGQAVNNNTYTLLPYGLGVAKDGTVWFGFQDNGSGHMDPDGKSYGDFGADGFYAEVHPDNSDIAYTESQNGGLRRTTDRGQTATGIAPPYTRVNFANWFSMDPLDGEHMITTANEVYETTSASTVTGGSWVEVFRFGVNPENRAIYTAQVADVHGPAIYAGACGDCGVTNNDESFQNALATNIGGRTPPKPETNNGWHFATAAGLPNRLITAIEIDHADPFTVYLGLGAYSSGLRGPHTFGEDPNDDAQLGAGNLFRSDDAGESFYSIQGNLPHMPINHIKQRGDQLLVATDFGVFISSDLNGSSWAPLGSGLPAAPVTQIKYLPGDQNQLFASLYGRHIWKYEFPPAARVEVAETDSGGVLDTVVDSGREAVAGLSRGGAAGPGLLLLAALAGFARRRRR